MHVPALAGEHVLRHGLAMHLLRQGTPLKTIGDLLGHRSVESTGVYLRLHVQDLRDVALPLPKPDSCPGARLKKNPGSSQRRVDRPSSVLSPGSGRPAGVRSRWPIPSATSIASSRSATP